MTVFQSAGITRQRTGVEGKERLHQLANSFSNFDRILSGLEDFEGSKSLISPEMLMSTGEMSGP